MQSKQAAIEQLETINKLFEGLNGALTVRIGFSQPGDGLVIDVKATRVDDAAPIESTKPPRKRLPAQATTNKEGEN
jgi:hypothetical protein